MPLSIERIVSGAQTGADRGGLDAAREIGVPYGGWVPAGRRSEDGQVPAIYESMEETTSADYPPRTWRNVRDADATVIFAKLPVSGGSRLTVNYCEEQDKPHLVLSARIVIGDPDAVVDTLELWLLDLADHGTHVKTLNVAGSRESSLSGLQNAVKQVIQRLLMK